MRQKIFSSITTETIWFISHNKACCLDWHILRLSMNMCLVKRTNSQNKTEGCSLKQFFPTHKSWYLFYTHLRGKPAGALNHESEAFKMPLVVESWKLGVVCFITNLCSVSRKQWLYSTTCPCFFTRILLDCFVELAGALCSGEAKVSGLPWCCDINWHGTQKKKLNCTGHSSWKIWTNLKALFKQVALFYITKWTNCTLETELWISFQFMKIKCFIYKSDCFSSSSGQGITAWGSQSYCMITWKA